jgi:RHS repeat-associated protein
MVYDGANAVMELNASNEVVWAWIHGPGLDQPVERIAFINGEARNRQVVHADGLGSVSALTDERGETVQTYAYAAFGGIREQTGTDLNRVTFTAREALGDSLGLFYYRHRVYDPNTGRFTSEDPLGFVDGANRYVYVGNNSINVIDPFGLREENEASKWSSFLNSRGKTWQFGVTASAGAGTGGNASSGMAISLSWRHGLQIGGYGTYGGGGHFGYSYGAGFECNVSQNTSIAQLAGETFEIGGGGGAVLGNLGGQINMPVDGANAAPTAGLTLLFAPQGVTGEAHAYVNITHVGKPWINIPNPFIGK